MKLLLFKLETSLGGPASIITTPTGFFSLVPLSSTTSIHLQSDSFKYSTHPLILSIVLTRSCLTYNLNNHPSLRSCRHLEPRSSSNLHPPLILQVLQVLQALAFFPQQPCQPREPIPFTGRNTRCCARLTLLTVELQAASRGKRGLCNRQL